MKIAITADVHLTDIRIHPERYNALENILTKISQENIDALIIAGDLFDETYNNYFEFDTLASRYNHINFHIIPGNHDVLIDNKAITSSNVEIYSSPTVKNLDESGLQFFFLPYQKDSVMGEVIASNVKELHSNKWVLIGHGDWESGMKVSNPLEPGVYMPLSKKDINSFKPANVFLGHIHKPLDDVTMCYPGSPCGLDITETGKRRFIVFNTENCNIEHHHVDTDIIYFSEIISILPLKDEETYLRNRIKEIIKSWDLNEEQKTRVKLRVKVRGYTSDIRKLNEIASEEFKDFKFYNGENIDLSEVFLSENYELEEIARKTAERINELELPSGAYQPTNDEILFHALKIIYGGK